MIFFKSVGFKDSENIYDMPVHLFDPKSENITTVGTVSRYYF